MRMVSMSVLALVVSAGLVSAQEYRGGDLRDVKVGMAVSDLPDQGYVGFACASDPQRKLSGWSGWRDCSSGPDGLRAVVFNYDPETSRDGTLVAGHPVVLTALIDDAGAVGGLKIDTDPKARLYLRKKAFLLGPQVKSRYGLDGWTCTQAQPEAGEQPVGGVYVKELCIKTMAGRSLVVDRSLFRKPEQDARSFTDETRVLITRTKG